MDFDGLLTLMIKAQKSSMRSGEEKKQFVLQNMEDGDTQVSQLIDFLIMILKDPAVHALFVSAGTSCASRFCRGKRPRE